MAQDYLFGVLFTETEMLARPVRKLPDGLGQSTPVAATWRSSRKVEFGRGRRSAGSWSEHEEPETTKPARPVREAPRRTRSANTSPRTLEKKPTPRGRPSLDQVAEGGGEAPSPRSLSLSLSLSSASSMARSSKIRTVVSQLAPLRTKPVLTALESLAPVQYLALLLPLPLREEYLGPSRTMALSLPLRRHALSVDELGQVVFAACSEQCSRANTQQFFVPGPRVDILQDAWQCSSPFVPSHVLDSSAIIDNWAHFCRKCSACIAEDKSGDPSFTHAFTTVPSLSRANGMVPGDIPAVLAGLTWVETVCIARARASRCCVKIKGHRPHQSKGNIVILPHAASELSRLLPLPASVIANEIVVIWVANQAEPLTADKIPKNLLTVRLSLCAIPTG
ncbi:hypothetical protein I350_05147 [Cryptococcus amylolentus CBS 6273]|uniref:DUF6570 domain-containing protein n=1 Tax=Cryptococcus amylolentus CBS 6273 TaxID=1296118 RepID=A0A1E3JUN0_9TREE|nr:hypothetical protein I350_05147 [Cryptococcus amylolentus CBS 6273]